MIKHNKQIYSPSVSNNNHSNQIKQDQREKLFNCNLKIMDNILFNQSDKETSSHQDDEDEDNNEKEELLNRKNKSKLANRHIDYVTKMDRINQHQWQHQQQQQFQQYRHFRPNKNFNEDIDYVDDQFDDNESNDNGNDSNEQNHHNEIIRFKNSENYNKNDYLQMAMHYKNLCKSYKKQLIESHKTIRELHLTLEAMERKSWIQKQQKNNLQLIKFESEENTKLSIEKCRVYCEKINRLTSQLNPENEEEEEAATAPQSATVNGQDSSEEIILNTLRNTFHEKKEIKSFSKSLTNLIKYINPTSKEINPLKKLNKINYSSLKSVINETLEFMRENSPKTFHCKCNGAYEFEKQTNSHATMPHSSSSLSSSKKPQTIKYLDSRKDLCLITSASPSPSSTSSSCSVSSSSSLNYPNSSNSSDSYYKHQPSVEFLMKCVYLIQDLFDVECFQHIPTKLNDVYYKLGQLTNFKKAIQNIFDPNENYTIEKLVCAVQTIHSQLNDQISTNLSNLLHSTNLKKVVDKFNMYDEYFPLFRELLDQIMKTLEISRLDQIMPSIRALKILATPALS